jgi:putative membrane protein
MMIEHHTQAKQRQAALQLSSTSSPLLQKLSSEGQSTLAKLRNESGQSFDRAYLQAQVDQHQKVLDMIDHKLLPSTQNSQLRSQIQNVRPTIQQHLQAARSALTAIESGQNEQGASGQGTGRSRSTGSGTEGPTQR